METSKSSKFFLITLGFIFVLLLGGVRYLTGPEWALTLFYLVPICIITWYVGKGAGSFIAVTSAISWLVADLIMVHSFSHCLIPCLNETFRLTIFLFIVFTLSKMKNALDNQEELAMSDPLTGVANRRAFFELASIEINRAARFKRPLSVAYIDLDNFKIVNDRFRHSKGDFLLKLLTEKIKSNTRAFDTLARLGGDEFILLLPETGSEAASIVVRRVKEKLVNLMEENKWPVTLSIGVITFTSPPLNVDVLPISLCIP